MSNATTVPTNAALLAVADEETTRALVREAMVADGFLPKTNPLPAWKEITTPAPVAVRRHFRLDLDGGGHLNVQDVGHGYDTVISFVLFLWPHFNPVPENLPKAVALIVPKLRRALAALERMLEATP